MILKNLGAPLSLWEHVSMKSKNFKNNDCANIWDRFKAFNYSVGSLIVLAKEGFIDKFNTMRPSYILSMMCLMMEAIILPLLLIHRS